MLAACCYLCSLSLFHNSFSLAFKRRALVIYSLSNENTVSLYLVQWYRVLAEAELTDGGGLRQLLHLGSFGQGLAV